MKKIFALTFLILASATAWGQTLTIRIDGWKNDTIYVRTQALELSAPGVHDTLVAQNGQVIITNTSQKPLMVSAIAKNSIVDIPGGWLSPNATTILTIMMPNKNETITGRLDGKLVTYSSTGDPFFTEYAKLCASLKPLDARIDSMRCFANRTTKEQLEEFKSTFFSIIKEIGDIRIAYVRNNPDSEASLGVLLGLSLDNIAELLPTLSDRVKTGEYKSLTAFIEKALDADKQKKALKSTISAGNPAPEFTLTALDGTQKSLSDFRGKWVVLDFWGSGCGWCIKGFPDMKEAYAKHRGQVEFIGIACGDKPETWRETVEKYALPWTQLINNLEFDVTKKYVVEAFPTKIIIDPQGVIQYVMAGESPEFYAELDKLLSNK